MADRLRILIGVTVESETRMVLERAVGAALDSVELARRAGLIAYQRSLVELRIRLRQREHDAPVAPSNLLWISPHCIEQKVANEPLLFMAVHTPGAVVGGNWDVQWDPIEDHPYHDLFVTHFENGVPWDETGFFQRHADAIERGHTAAFRSYESVDDLYEHFCEVDDLYESIRTDGYLSQRELLERDAAPLGVPSRRTPPAVGEIAVAIDRDGEILFADGGHRLFLARLLAVDSIPVYVHVRHERWQSIRDEIYRARRSGDRLTAHKEYLDHPDVRDMTD